MNLFFSFLVCLFFLAIGCVIGKLAKGITFFGFETDNQKQVHAAANSDKWRWPSDMHKYGKGKARMKDVGVLGAALMQRLLKDRKSEYPLVMFCNIAMVVSCIFLFLVANVYWDYKVSLLLSVLFIICFWPHQITLIGGYHNVAMALLLITIFCLQRAMDHTMHNTFWYWCSGVSVGLMMFASASGRKFLPLVLGGFIFSQRDVLSPFGVSIHFIYSYTDGLIGHLSRVLVDSFQKSNGLKPLGGLGLKLVEFIPFSVLFLTIFLFAAFFCYRKVVTVIYYDQMPPCLNNLIANKKKYPLQRYINFHRKIISVITKISMAVVLYLSLSLILSRATSFYKAQLVIFFGFITAVIFLTAPNVVENIKGYLTYWYTPKNQCHFRLYVDYFKKMGKPIKDDMRGEGVKWVILYFIRMIPFHMVYFLMSILLLLYMVFYHGFNQVTAWKAIGVVCLSLSPIIYGEVTKSPQLGRAYFPGFSGILLLIGYGTFEFTKLLSAQGATIFWLAYFLLLLITMAWNCWIFFKDILPSRMTVPYFIRSLKKLGINKFYTYDTAFNNSFVNAMPSEMKKTFGIYFFRSLSEVKEGYVVVPGISAKAFQMESYKEGINNQDFEEDPFLTKLIDSKNILGYAVARFKTFGTSRFWVHESEMPSYRELILKDITERDRWRSYAWILDASKIKT